MEEINICDLAYAAGLIDGEGYLSFQCRRKFVPEYDLVYEEVYTAIVAVTNTHYKALRGMQVKFGGSLCLHGKGAPKKQAWRWTIVGFPAKEFLTTIQEFLIIKLPQANLILNATDDNLLETVEALKELKRKK